MSDEGDNTSVFIYNGVGEVPEDVTYVRVNPTVTFLRRAFDNRPNLEEVELPEGLVRIGDNAFSNCKNLKRINLPSTLVRIGRYAFSSCIELEDITLPDELQRLDEGAFYNCLSLQQINIPPNLRAIREETFMYCESLTDIIFSEGLREIEKDGFSRCSSLVSVTLPSSLKVIGVDAFRGNEVLNQIHMPDSLESIDRKAFEDCNFSHFRIPPQVTTEVGISILESNYSLVSLELSENILECTASAQEVSLRNVSLPPDCRIGEVADEFDSLETFPDNDAYDTVDDADTDDIILDALQHRFDDLPIHKICYYQSYHDNETTMQSLKREINPWTSKPPGQLSTTGKQQDYLGMTPLHILACSTKPTIEMYRLLIEKYPETLIMKDKWGDIPLLYAIWCSAPSEVVDLLVESYKSMHPDYEFDWKGMILTLVKRRVHLANIQTLINTQQESFPNQKYDMQQVVKESAVLDKKQWAFQNGKYTRIETFRYLFQVSITKRLDLLGIGRWREELENRVSSLPRYGLRVSKREEDTKAVYDRLFTYESIKEATSVLELALWKTKIDDSRNKRTRTEENDSYKEQCRINCGADIIIRNVLPYLCPRPLVAIPVIPKRKMTRVRF